MKTETTNIDHACELIQAHYDLLAKAVEFAAHGSIGGYEDHGIDENEACVSSTRDTLDDFRENARQTWNEARGRQEFEIEGHACIHWETVQARKGDRRESLTIIDLGGIRLCYQL